METKDLVFSRSVLEFATIAKEFCVYLEELDVNSTGTFINTCHKLLPLLYYKTTLLPKTSAICEDSNEQFVSELDYTQVETRVAETLHQYNDFIVVSTPECNSTEEHMTASIAEYLADIYQDLKNFNCRYKIGNVEIMNDAIWECTENFKEFWGVRLADLIKQMHILHYSDIDFEQVDSSANNDNTSIWNDEIYTKED